MHAVNDAERCVAAAMMHHTRLAATAKAYSERYVQAYSSSSSSSSSSSKAEERSRPEPPASLVSLWKQARRVRVAEGEKDRMQGETVLYAELAEAVCARALLLLEVSPSPPKLNSVST